MSLSGGMQGFAKSFGENLVPKTFVLVVFHIIYVFLNVCNLIKSNQTLVVFIRRCDEVAGLAKFSFYFMMCTYNMWFKALLRFDVCLLLCRKEKDSLWRPLRKGENMSFLFSIIFEHFHLCLILRYSSLKSYLVWYLYCIWDIKKRVFHLGLYIFAILLSANDNDNI